MIDYEVIIDRINKRFIIKNLPDNDSIPLEIPNSIPQKKWFVDLFLHKADIDRSIEFINCISQVPDKNSTINEGLFIAALNNCMKCFKYSKARTKLNKNIVFAHDKQLYSLFCGYENMRDKHLTHDENGMLQPVAFLLVNKNQRHIMAGPASVIWNRIKLDYFLAGTELKKIMNSILEYLRQEIDKTGKEILSIYLNLPSNEKAKWNVATCVLATSTTKR